MDNQIKEKNAPYGYCPICGSKGVMRQKRLNGNDKCGSGHTYESRDALSKNNPLVVARDELVTEENSRKQVVEKIYDQVFEDLQKLWDTEFRKCLDVKIDKLNGQVHVSVTLSKQLVEQFPELLENFKKNLLF